MVKNHVRERNKSFYAKTKVSKFEVSLFFVALDLCPLTNVYAARQGMMACNCREGVVSL